MLLMLVELLDTNDKQKFTFLYEEYRQPLLAYARSILKSQSLAEDALQEAYLRVLKNLHKIDVEKCRETKTYLVTIVRNVSINLYHRYIKTPMVDLEEIVEQPQPGHLDDTWRLYDIGELSRDVKRWIETLTEEEQTLLLYRIHYQWTYEQIESALGIKASTASSKICRARNKLVAMYKRERGEQNG